MRLAYSRFFQDFDCPTCGMGFEIESTWEDSVVECYGKTLCPECGESLEIAINVEWTATICDKKSREEKK